MDRVSKQTRSRIMATVRSKDTEPEWTVRRGLFARGLRYRLHASRLPGRPDLIFPQFRTAVFVHGCFWHGHEFCPRFRPPASNLGYWVRKIQTNRDRDNRNCAALVQLGWRVRVIWECELRRQPRGVIDELLDQLADWVRRGG